MTTARPSLDVDGWTLVSAESRHAESPQTFEIPPRATREALLPGAGVKLLFDIQTREAGRMIDRGVDRMWVIVKSRTESGYLGVLDNEPGRAENLELKQGDSIHFGPEHVAEVTYPPRAYILEKYGESFFDSSS